MFSLLVSSLALPRSLGSVPAPPAAPQPSPALGSVNLYTAGDFSILSKAGISTTPGTTITGDIGVSPIAASAITGFSQLQDGAQMQQGFSKSSMVQGKCYAANYAGDAGARTRDRLGSLGLAARTALLALATALTSGVDPCRAGLTPAKMTTAISAMEVTLRFEPSTASHATPDLGSSPAVTGGLHEPSTASPATPDPRFEPRRDRWPTLTRRGAPSPSPRSSTRPTATPPPTTRQPPSTPWAASRT